MAGTACCHRKLHGSGSRRKGWPWHRGSTKKACWRWPRVRQPGLLLPMARARGTHAWIKGRPAVLHVHRQPLMRRFWHRTVPGFIWALHGTSCRQCNAQLISQRCPEHVVDAIRAAGGTSVLVSGACEEQLLKWCAAQATHHAPCRSCLPPQPLPPLTGKGSLPDLSGLGPPSPPGLGLYSDLHKEEQGAVR